MSEQWRAQTLRSDKGDRIVWLGLDYTAAQAGLALAGIEVTPELWAEVRIIEDGAREARNED